MPVAGFIIYMGGLHQTAFEAPQSHQSLTTSPQFFANSSTHQLKVAHVLSTRCGCSKRIGKYLLRRGPNPQTEEMIVQVDEPLPFVKELQEKGFKVITLSSDQLEKDWAIDAVPLMQASLGKAAYSGGYQDFKTGDYLDLEIFASLEKGETHKSLPILGCASSLQLAQKIDPLGMKYTGIER